MPRNRIEVAVRHSLPARLRGPAYTGDLVTDTCERLHFELEVMQRRLSKADWVDARACADRVRAELDELFTLLPAAEE